MNKNLFDFMSVNVILIVLAVLRVNDVLGWTGYVVLLAVALLLQLFGVYSKLLLADRRGK